MPIRETRNHELRWINITGLKSLQDPEVRYLEEHFRFHPLTLQDCVNVGQRPKIERYRDHLFLVLLYPVYNRKLRAIEPAEVDFFVGRDFLISVHDEKLPPLVELFRKLEGDERLRIDLLGQNVVFALYEILSRLLNYCFPMLDHVSRDLREIERKIFEGQDRTMVEEILIGRRNVVEFRKTMQAHKNVLKKLEEANEKIGFFDHEKAKVYFENLIERTKEIWDTLESFKESIEAIQETNESLISFRLNRIMKTFTSISVVVFILTLVATLFGIGVAGTPLVGFPFAFWAILALEALVALLVVAFFRRKRWLQ